MMLSRAAAATAIIVICILLSCSALLASSCSAGNCSRLATISPMNATVKSEEKGNYSDSHAPKEQEEGEKSSNKSEENSMNVKHAAWSTKSEGKGVTASSMDLKKTMATKTNPRQANGRSDFRSHGDYDSYDPAPALVKPPFKLIPN